MRGVDHFIYMPLGDARKATGLVEHIANAWWCVHPEKGLLFYPYSKSHPRLKQSSPQCNSSESIARRLCPDFAAVQHIEMVLKPIDVRDYE